MAIANAQLYERAQSLAVVEERTRVARELHDAASQRLFSLVYEAHAARMGAVDGEAAEVLERIERQASEALRELRGLVHALRPKSLERDGLAAALAAHLDGLRRTHGVSLVFDADPELGSTLEQEHGLMRIAQEAVHNAVRHGSGAPVRIRLRRLATAVELGVRDRARAPTRWLRGSTWSARWGTGAWCASACRSGAAVAEANRLVLVDDHAVVREGCVRSFGWCRGSRWWGRRGTPRRRCGCASMCDRMSCCWTW